MISTVLIHRQKSGQITAAEQILEQLNMSKNHPDLLWLDCETDALGVEAVKKIIDHFTLTPYSALGRVVVIIGAENLSVDGQNALLKTLEEPPEQASLILTVSSEKKLLPTILSRCQIINVGEQVSDIRENYEDVEKLLESSVEERFQIVEKTEDKELLLNALVSFYHEELLKDPQKVDHAKLLIQAGEWKKANVSIRAILEYLMLQL